MGTSIIILTFNKLEYTKECIESVRKYTMEEDYEIVVVDNGSVDGTRDYLCEQKDIVTVLNSENLGFPKGCNIGIEASNKENDILLLNNDTIVTNNWLSNLKKCLFSNELIAAVGPITNSAAYYQKMDVSYKEDMNEMQIFAKDNNVSDSDRWEERQKLIGFCLLIKRNIINEIGMLDEIFTPGNFEDDDYCIRILDRGYKIVLCKDTFIHHYGGVSFSRDDRFNKLIKNNEEKFEKKWGFNSRENMNIYKIYNQLISNSKTKILELFCGTGATALYLKQNLNCEYFGFENNGKALNFARGTMEFIKSDDLKNNIEQYDYILISDFYKFIKNDYLVKNIIELLKPETRLIFNLKDSENSEKNILKIAAILGKKYNLIDGINEVNLHNKKLSRYYLVFGQPIYVNILNIISNIDNEVEIENNFNLLISYLKKENSILSSIINAVKIIGKDKINILNTLGVLSSENEIINCTQFFIEALKYDNMNFDVLMNYSELLYNLEEYDIALSKMKQIKNRNELWQKLYAAIEKKSKFRNKIKFLIRRLEFKVEEEEALENLMNVVKHNNFNEKIFIDIVDREVVDRVYILNYIAIQLFENEVYDKILPLLNRAYEIDEENIDTNYNLAYILNAFGEREVALQYLNKVRVKNEDIINLEVMIKGEI